MTERMNYNQEIFQSLPKASESLPTGQAGLTLQEKTPYARGGSAHMSDTANLEVLTTAPVEPRPGRDPDISGQPVLVKPQTEKDEKIDEKDKPRLQELQNKVNKIDADTKRKRIEHWTEKELQDAYTQIHADLSGIKLLTSPKTFLRALTIAGPMESKVREQLLQQHDKKEERRRELKGWLVKDRSTPAKEKLTRHLKEEHQDEVINEAREKALRYLWERKYTPEELRDPAVQKGLEAAVAAGYLPVPEPEREQEVDEPTKRELELQRRVLQKAEEVGENAELDDAARKQKAWDVLIKKRHTEDKSFDVTKIDESTRQQEIGKILLEQHPDAGQNEAELIKFREATEEAIIDAHNVGADDETKGVYNYSLKDIGDKYEVLEEVGFQKEDIRELMEAGIVGRGRGRSRGRSGGGGGGGRTTIDEEIAAAPEEDRESIIDELNRFYGRDVQEDVYKNMVDQADDIEESLHERIDAANGNQMEALLAEKGAIEGNLTRVASEYAKRNAEISDDLFIKNYLRDFGETIQAARQALASGNIDEAKRIANELADTIGERDRTYWTDEPRFKQRLLENDPNRERMQTVNDFDDVLKEIIEFDPGTYGDGKQDALYETRKVVNPDGTTRHERTGNINQGNFKKWVQERMVYNSNFDPDAPIQFFSAVAIENNNLYRPVSLGVMVSQYKQFFRRKNSDVVLEELKDEIVDMGWLDGTLRNTDVNYRQGMTNDTKFGDLMVEAFKGNVLGKEASRSGVNALASVFLTDAEFDPTKKAGQGDMKIGMATESAFLFYYNMTDEEKLQELFDDHLDIFFSYERMQDAITHAMIGNNRDPKDNAARERFLVESGMSEILKQHYDREVTGKVRVEERTNEDGEPEYITYVLDEEKGATIKDRKKFLLAMNVFNPPMKNRLQNTVARNLVKFVAGAEAGLVDDTFEDNSQSMHAKGTLDFAEMRAFWMTYPLGAAARQDVAYAAVNAMTKVTHFKHYLKKQADPSRAGGIGNPLEYSLLKEIAVDPVTGVLTDQNRSTISMIEDLHKARRDKSITEQKMREEVQNIIGRWTYKDLAWKQYAPQHMANAFKEFHDRTSGKEIHIDSFASFDIFGHVVYDHAKMISEVQEGLIKPSRYRWSTHKLNYSESRRELVDHGKGISYKDSTLAEEMFGPQVLLTAAKMQHHEFSEILKHGDPGEREELEKYLKSRNLLDAKGNLKPISSFIDSKGRYLRTKDEAGKEGLSLEARGMLEHKDFGRLITKSYLASKFAVQLYSVTNFGTGHKRLDYATRELIIATLGHIPAGIHEDETDFRKTHLTEFYFNEYDLKLMRQMSGNGVWQNFFRAAGVELAGGGFEAFGQGLKIFFKNIMKI